MDGPSPSDSPPHGLRSNQCYRLDIEENDLITAGDSGIDARRAPWNLIPGRGLTSLADVGAKPTGASGIRLPRGESHGVLVWSDGRILLPCAHVADGKQQEFASDPYTIDRPWPRYSRYDDRLARDTRYDDRGLVSVEVGCYCPNPCGLCDMLGNVGEWTLSAYRACPCDSADGRRHPFREGMKVIRGGSWRHRPRDCRSASRWRLPGWQPASTGGFRVALAAD